MASFSRLTLVAIVVLGICGCGSGGTSGQRVARLVSGGCQESGTDAKLVVQSCDYTLIDGSRYTCQRQLKSSLGAGAIRAAGCRSLPALRFSAAERTLIARLNAVLACLGHAGVRAIGAPNLPTTPSSADGEVTIGSPDLTFIGFYLDAAKARRLEPQVRRSAAHLHNEVDRRGSVTILWSRTPTAQMRAIDTACVWQQRH